MKATLLTEKTGDSGRCYPEGTEVAEALGRHCEAFGVRLVGAAPEAYRVEVYGASGYDYIRVGAEEIAVDGAVVGLNEVRGQRWGRRNDSRTS